MKRIYILTILSILIISCEEFLDVSPETFDTLDSFFENEDEVDRAVTALYARNRQINNDHQWKIGEMRSDNSSYQENSADQGGLGDKVVDMFTMASDNGLINGLWSNYYGGISRCNYILEFIDDIEFTDEERKEYRLGETLFFRSWFYFNLVRNFENIPFITQNFTSPEEALSETYTDQVDPGVVYDSILIDAQRAIDLLPASWGSEDDIGRASKGAALMLKAKIHMKRKEFAQAIPLLEEMRTLGYELLEDYEQIFNPDNKNHSEEIFTIQYNRQLGQPSDFLSRFVPFQSGDEILGNGIQANVRGAVNQPTEDIIDQYQFNDRRFGVNISFYVTEDGDSIPWMSKFNYPFEPTNERKQDVNWPMFRYADALLMLAECYNEQEPFSQRAIGLVNLIRLRAGIPFLTSNTTDPRLLVNDQESLRLAIERERRLELAFENHRWFDLVRTDRAVEVMTLHGIAQKAEKAYLPAEAYQEIRTVLAIPFGQVQQFGYEQNLPWQ